MIAALFAVAAQATACLSYEPAVVRLEGRVVERRAYGPPGYGEDPEQDQLERFRVLVLDRPICVDGRDDDEINMQDERGVREVTLVTPTVRLPQGRVVLTGSLFHSHTAHHRTAVLMDVKTAVPAK